MLIISLLYLIFSVANIDCSWYKVCDGNSVHIDCEPGTTLRIKNTHYCAEEFSGDFCSDSVNKYCCKPDFSNNVVSKLCDNQQCCVFPCGSYMFAGLCPEGRKCLFIDYTCAPVDSSNEKCRPNEVWSDCRSACPKMCPDLNNTQPNFCTKQCVCPGWHCEPGYERDRFTGICLKPKFCPKPDDKHERFSWCANKQRYCEIWYKPPPDCTTISTTPDTDDCCEPGYKCRRPYMRDPFSGYCVVEEGCPIFK